MTLQAEWIRLVDWCRVHAPNTAAAVLSPVPFGALKDLVRSLPREWPAELDDWFSLHAGLSDDDQGLLPGGFTPLAPAEVRDEWQTQRTIWDRIAARPISDRESLKRAALHSSPGPAYDIDAREQDKAGSAASMYLPSYLPVGRNIGGWLLFVDLREGDATGCVRSFRREDTDHEGHCWPSIAELIGATASALAGGGSVDGWIPEVADGYLTWSAS